MARTGLEVAIEMASRFQGRDWVSLLADQARHTRDYVEWNLRQPEPLPTDIARAVELMLADDGANILNKAKPGDLAKP
ncbi:hypothetical protein [Bosea sp. BK604]|uniref:hypothetical protein n=1 Tax=Bosea sp. BK604 TaxID=2512180 RepID=UPI00104EF99C|nr:hypothetical protein [Bosea sp. BK604]TCR65660.1 hypothetical protein EV560_105423 [Bosea sp. BK604]